MEVRIGVADKSERREIGGRDLDAELLGKLADQRVLRRLAGLDLAAGEFPEPGKRPPLAGAWRSGSALAVEQHAGGDENERRSLSGRCGHRPVRTGNRR